MRKFAAVLSFVVAVALTGCGDELDLGSTTTLGRATTAPGAPPTTTSTTRTAAAASTTRGTAVATTRAGTVARSFTYGTTACPPAAGAATQTRSFSAPFKQCIDPANTYTATIKTNKGVLKIRLDSSAAPGTVNNFVSLALNKYFDGIGCHRILIDFVAQCGDPTGSGSGGPGYKFDDELPKAGQYKVGSIAMANAGPNTNGSQFFIITGAKGAGLPPNYSLFGEVTEGLDVLKAINAVGAATDPSPPKEKITLESVTISIA